MFFKRLMKNFAKTMFLLFIGGSAVAVGGLCVVFWQVNYGDNSQLKKSTIMSKIKEETTIYYLDEKTRLGSLFESRYRRYIPIDEIPAHLINAVVASEDKNFFTHFGIDPLSIVKAFGQGVLSGGKFRRGASSITQQTVKNIIGDWEASFARKFREMIRAMQLEKLYSKYQILEFYLNQFHVAGNGTGVSVAAKYYFDKDARDLGLVEAAFIAGSLKGPGKYTPFTKFTKEAKEKAIFHANQRKNYVLGRMLEQGWISKEDFKKSAETPVPFNRGEFRNSEVALVRLIKNQLNKKEILEAIGLMDAREIHTAGLKVYSTIDHEFQKAGQLAMRTNLSRLETILGGFASENQDKFSPLRTLTKDSFVYGKVEAIEGKGFNDFRLKINVGMPTGYVSHLSLVRYAKLLDLVDGVGYEKHLKAMKESIKIGDILYLQVRKYDKKSQRAVFELRKRPDISGGLIAIDKGEVRTLISGFDTLGFNRALYAKRPPGSVFKSMVFFAAIQLGWSILDSIENIRRVFHYQGTFYYPRPDHRSPYQSVSMLWAGVMSENLAAVALGARLVEKLSFEQFKDVMEALDLLPRGTESLRDFYYRVGKETGISIDSQGIKEFQLINGISDMAPDLVFSGQQDHLMKIKQMWLGEGYHDEVLKIMEDEELSDKEKKSRVSLVNNNLKRFTLLRDRLLQDWKFIENSVRAGFVSEDGAGEELFNKVIKRFRVLPNKGERPELAYYDDLSEWQDKTESLEIFQDRKPGRPINPMDMQAIWGAKGGSSFAGQASLDPEQVLLEGFFSVKNLLKLDQLIQEKIEQVDKVEDPIFRFYQHHDFRVSLGLNYLVSLSKACGVYSDLKPVLSLPLGTSDLSAGEVAKLYQTFLEGKTYKFYKSGPENQLNFIRRIEDRFGNILFEAKPIEHQLVKPEVAHQVREVLRKTVTHGTGRRARGELFVALNSLVEEEDKKALHIRVPSFGKTGTTNEFTTSYYAGLLPYPKENGQQVFLDSKNSYVISAYVGYDLNKTMKKGRQRIYGGSGALPLWADFSKKVIQLKNYKKSLDIFDINLLYNKEWALSHDHMTPYLVNLPRGSVLRVGVQSDLETWGTTNISRTGESYQNLFRVGSRVKSTVFLPRNKKKEDLYRIFDLFAQNHNLE